MEAISFRRIAIGVMMGSVLLGAVIVKMSTPSAIHPAVIMQVAAK